MFDVDERLKRLSDIGEQLESYGRLVDFDIFRPVLDKSPAHGGGAKGGRPLFDPVMMFNIPIIQARNNLSDDQTEFLTNDRLSFMRFPGLGLSDKVPDAKTIWAFRERLNKAGVITDLFDRFDQYIRDAGYIPMSGQLVDAGPIASPKQRNGNGEKAAIKAGKVPEGWKKNPAKLCRKDRDGRWTVKFRKAKKR